MALLLTFLVGCESFLDVNIDPNNPTEADVAVRLPAVILGTIHSAYYGDPSGWAVEWMQQTAYYPPVRPYEQIHDYELQDVSADDWWSFHYAGVLNETRNIMRETDPGPDGAYHGLAKFLHAWTFALTTDLWGPVPFTEALDSIATPSPVYDPQPMIYAAVDQWFDEAAVEMVNPSLERIPRANDLLFEGFMPGWVKLLRHVQARHALRLVNAPWANAQEQAQATLDALDEGLESNTDNVMLPYEGVSGARNPLFRFSLTGELFKASEYLVEGMRAKGDPRLGILVEPTLLGLKENMVVYHGRRNGGFPTAIDSAYSEVGRHFVEADAPLRVASYADAKFMEAEARLILSGPAAADAPYRAGIRADMESLDVATEAINAYLASRPSLAQVAAPLADIMWEKGLANYLSIEPWNDWRRTGYPAIQPVQGATLTGIPVRIRTPQSELATNRANVEATGIDTGLQGMLWSSDESWWGHH